MPLVAEDSKGVRIDITRILEPKKVLDMNNLFCPLCKGKFFIAHGPQRKYFRHRVEICKSDYKHENETPQHLFAKEWLRNYLEARPEYKELGAVFTLEHPISEIKRIADIHVKFKNGVQIVHEIQLSNIPIEEIAARTRDYFSLGIDVYWWIGNKADNKSIKDWCYDTFGEFYLIKIDEDVKEIAYTGESRSS